MSNTRESKIEERYYSIKKYNETTNVELKHQLGEMAQKNLHLQQVIVGAGLRC